ncbi:hypothetical protein GGG16DRAFT_108071 [Schizophyllum commune]
MPDLIYAEGPWHDDGNIILRADNYGFQVHLNFLAAISTCFHGLNELSKPDKMDKGKPLVDLDDEPWKLESFLRASYAPEHPLATKDRYAILELARKYDADEVHRVVMQWMSRDLINLDFVDNFYKAPTQEDWESLQLLLLAHYGLGGVIHQGGVS